MDKSRHIRLNVLSCPRPRKVVGMEIGVKDAAMLLNLSEKTIYRWIKQGRLPGFKIGDQYRFNRSELLEWATSNRINISADIFSDSNGKSSNAFALNESLSAGGIYYRVGGLDKTSVLESIVGLMKLPEEVDRAFLLQVLVARESLGSTGIGGGVAIPHARNPIVMRLPKPIVTLCFLEQPINFGAIDGQPVHTLFTLVSPVISAHLSLLSKIAFAMHHPAFVKVIKEQGSREEILKAALDVDSAISAASATPGKKG